MTATNLRYDELQATLAPLRERLLAHPIYSSLASLADVRVFLEHHVFAVWDFMSLLKALQRAVTSLDEVWRPVGDPPLRRLVNEIVLGEESDLVDGEAVSHFELYRRAMAEAGAGTDAIDAAVAAIGAGRPVAAALAHAPAAARAFSATTFAAVSSGSLPAVAAAFTLGREDVIPSMFVQLVRDLERRDAPVGTLVRYLERHIELDGDEHGPMAARLLCTICGDDVDRWRDAEAAAADGLRARIALWDGVVAALRRGS